ncbi:MAG: hypothetical protein ACOCVN_02580 [bacterium]
MKDTYKLKDGIIVFIYFMIYTPSIIVILIPYEFASLWWSIIVILSFILGVVFCALKKQLLNKKMLDSRHNLKIFKINFIFYNITLFFISVFIFIPLLLLESNQLSFANSLALLTAIIVSFKLFRIETAKNNKEKMTL